MENGFLIRQMNPRPFIQVDGLTSSLFAIWRNPWCWNPEPAIKQFIFYARGVEKLILFSSLIGLFSANSGMECICLTSVLVTTRCRKHWWSILFLNLSTPSLLFQGNLLPWFLTQQSFCRLHAAFGYRIQDYHRRWVGFILSWISVRTGVAVLN